MVLEGVAYEGQKGRGSGRAFGRKEEDQAFVAWSCLSAVAAMAAHCRGTELGKGRRVTLLFARLGVWVPRAVPGGRRRELRQPCRTVFAVFPFKRKQGRIH